MRAVAAFRNQDPDNLRCPEQLFINNTATSSSTMPPALGTVEDVEKHAKGNRQESSKLSQWYDAARAEKHGAPQGRTRRLGSESAEETRWRADGQTLLLYAHGIGKVHCTPIHSSQHRWPGNFNKRRNHA